MSQFNNQNVRSSHPTMALSPAVIKFTQDSIAMCFQNGNELNQTCEEIVKGYISISSFPTIKVFSSDNEYYSQDNRRLYVFRVLNFLGLLDEIKVKVYKFMYIDKVTTENNGCHVRVRSRPNENGGWVGRRTYRHCSCFKGRKKMLPEWWDTNLNCHKDFAYSRASRPLSYDKPNHFQPNSDVKRNKIVFVHESASYGSGNSWPYETLECKRSDEPQIGSSKRPTSDRQTNRVAQNVAFAAFILSLIFVFLILFSYYFRILNFIKHLLKA